MASPDSPEQPKITVSHRTARTPEKGQAILAALREKPSFAAACRKARVSRSIFYDWRHEDPAFDAAVIKAREEGLDALEDALVTRGAKNDTTAAIFMLKSLRRSIYADRLEHTGEGGAPLEIILTRVTRESR
jgi:hypothetical protein